MTVYLRPLTILLGLAILSACGTSTATPTPVAPVATVSPPPSTPQPTTEPELPTTPSAPVQPVHAVLVTLNDEQNGIIARPVGPDSLADLPGYEPIQLRHHYRGAASPDGRWWAAITWPTDTGFGGELHLIDLTSWQDAPTAIKFNNYVPLMSFSPDGSRLVIAKSQVGPETQGVELTILNMASPDQPVTVALDFFPGYMHFSADGAQLFLYGMTWKPSTGFAVGSPQVAAIEVTNGTVLWSLSLTTIKDGQYEEPTTEFPNLVNSYHPGVAFSPDGRWLYVIHADEDLLTTVNLSAGTMRTVTIAEQRTLLDWLVALTASTAYAKGPTSGVERSAVISPDGSRLYVTTIDREQRKKDDVSNEIEVIPNYRGLEVIDTQSGERLGRMDTVMSLVAISPNGRWLYVVPDMWSAAFGQAQTAPTPAVEFVDSEQLEVVRELATGAFNGYWTLPNDDGRIYVTWNESTSGAYTTLQLLDTETNEEVASRRILGWIVDLFLLPR